MELCDFHEHVISNKDVFLKNAELLISLGGGCSMACISCDDCPLSSTTRIDDVSLCYDIMNGIISKPGKDCYAVKVDTLNDFINLFNKPKILHINFMEE